MGHISEITIIGHQAAIYKLARKSLLALNISQKLFGIVLGLRNMSSLFFTMTCVCDLHLLPANVLSKQQTAMFLQTNYALKSFYTFTCYFNLQNIAF